MFTQIPVCECLIAVLFIIAKNVENNSVGYFLLVGEWLYQLCSIHTMEY